MQMRATKEQRKFWQYALKGKARVNLGFTLVELLVVILIVGVLAAIALPNFMSAQARAKESSVRGNMRTAQIAAESYATDYSGVYPDSVDSSYESYFPGGGNDGQSPGNALVNPFTGKQGYPNLGAGLTTAQIQTIRTTSGTSVSGGAVGIEYDVLSGSGQSGYAILGAKGDGTAVSGTNVTNTLILSNSGS